MKAGEIFYNRKVCNPGNLINHIKSPFIRYGFIGLEFIVIFFEFKVGAGIFCD